MERKTRSRRAKYRLPEGLSEDIPKLLRMVEEMRAGSMDPARFRAFRVPLGIYEERQDGSYMVRIRIPGGRVSPRWMRVLAETARRYGNGTLHVTTRQDLQIHGVSLDNIHPALEDLLHAGLSSKGGGGNTVRNVTACPYAGVCRDELFDVGPHASAVTEYLLSDPSSFQLPRKYKIAFSGCPSDCAAAMVNDLGFIAHVRNGVRGFTVYVGGGMGANPRVGGVLEQFIQERKILAVAEAVKRVFDRFGNRRNRHRARLRYLVSEMGFDRFVELYRNELRSVPVRYEALPDAEERETVERTSDVPRETDARAGFRSWRDIMVRAQKQPGYYIVDVPLARGDISSETLEALANVTESFGEGGVRSTQAQNLAIVWVHERELAALHGALDDLGLASVEPAWLREMVSCTGADTCRLGVCLSRGLLDAVRRELHARGLDFAEAQGLRIHINGCPNSCGRHPIASIGLVGAARRSRGRLVPVYVVKLGGRLGEGAVRLAEGKHSIPARRVPVFVAQLLSEFRAAGAYPDFDAFLDDGGREIAAGLLEEQGSIPTFEEDPSLLL